MNIDVTVTFDFVCPWCYVGVKRLTRAIDSLSDDFAFNVCWMPFELNPELPVCGVDRVSYRATKYGETHGRMLDAQVEAQARYDGISLDMRSIKTMANSRLAHRLHLLAEEKKFERQFILAVYKAYFDDGINIGCVEELVRIAESIHISRDEARTFLDDPASEGCVIALEEEARTSGVHAVPNFMIGPTTIAGAVSWTELRKALVRATDSDLPPLRQQFYALKAYSDDE